MTPSTQYSILKFEQHRRSSVRPMLSVGSSNLHSQGSKSIATTAVPTSSTFAALSATAPAGGRLQAACTSIDLHATVYPKFGYAMFPSWWWVAGHCLLGASLHHVGTSYVSLIFFNN